ncbi:O-antigen ligase family protein [Methylobacter sp. Wu1]|uniref:O-antigen ligase family protein n=1 Tax=Methylobacter sp. Wu1 TaxID=3119359 RepID=UPI002F93E944
MPPKLALLICIVYVFFLLKVEQKRAPKLSGALWIPSLWMLQVASKPLGTWFGSGGEEGGSALDQVFLSTVLVLGLIVLASRGFSYARAIRDNPALIMLVVYMFFSVFWSDMLFIALKRWIREVIAVVMAFVILSEPDPRQAMRSLLTRTIYILIPFSLILIKYFPEYGIQYRAMGGQMWIGVAMQKNGLGRLCLIAAFFLIWTLIRRRQKRDDAVGKHQTLADVSVLMLTLFIMSGPGGQYSATALISLAGGLAAFMGLLWAKKHRIAVGAGSLAALMIFIFGLGTLQPFLGGAIIKGISSNFQRDVTLTGRTEIWAGLMPDVMRSPVLGSGFASFWNPITVELHEIGEAHSGYLDVILDTGFVGLLFLAIFLISSCRKAQRELQSDFDFGCLWICYLLMALVHNITESSFDSLTSPLPAIILFLTVMPATVTSSISKKDIESSTLPHKRFVVSRKKKTSASLSSRGGVPGWFIDKT